MVAVVFILKESREYDFLVHEKFSLSFCDLPN